MFATFAERLRNGDHQAALAAARTASDQAHATGDSDLRGIALNCTGLAQHALGDFGSAAQSHQQAKDLSRRSDVRGFAALRKSLAGIAAGESTAYPQTWKTGSAPGQLAALARSQHPHLAPLAGVELGGLLRGEQHYVAAIRAYRAVVDSGHPWYRPQAAAPLAELLHEIGDHDGATRALAHASAHPGTPDLAGLALSPLDEPEPPCWLPPVRTGLDHYHAGDLGTARDELRAAATGDWQYAAHQASIVLAGLELWHGDPATARRILSDLADTADFTHGPRAAVALTILEAAATPGTDPVGALAGYLIGDQDAVANLKTLAQSQHPSAGMFAVLLGEPCPETGDRPAAGYSAYLSAIDLTRWDDADHVRNALGQACESASDLLPWAALLLGEASLANIYWNDESQSLFELALEVGPRALLPRAAAGLASSSPADSWQSEQRYELAEELLDGDLPTEAVPPLAWLITEKLISRAGDLDGARAALERIAETDPEFGAPALAVRLLLDEDVEGMRSVFQRLARWDEQSLEMASEHCMSVLWHLPKSSGTTRQALRVLADLGARHAFQADRVLDRLAEVCEIQHDLEGELAAREAINLRHFGGHPGEGVLKVARRHYLAGDLDQAIELYRRVSTPEFPEARGKAAVDLGVLLRHQDRHEEAQELLAAGVDPEHCFKLGADLEGAGRIDEAMLAWELIADTDDVTWVVRANYYLGEAHAGRGETDAAIAAYQRAGATEDSYFCARAWYELGCLYQDRGDLDLAAQAQQRVADIGARLGKDGETVLGACQLRLAELETLSGDTDAARRRLLDMVDNGDRGMAAMGAMMLGGAAKELRDEPEARRWYEWVIDSGDLFQRELALTHLGELYYWLGDREQSREFYQRTLNSTRSSPDLVAEAAYRMGEMAGQDGDTDQAVQYLQRARDTGDATFGPQAEELLERLNR